jgi:hypothetical protein
VTRCFTIKPPRGIWIIISLFLLFLPIASHSHAQDDPTCETGTVLEGAFPTYILGDDFAFKVYLPPCYDPFRDEPYPVIYLMHGSNRDHNHFVDLGIADVLDRGIASGSISPAGRRHAKWKLDRQRESIRGNSHMEQRLFDGVHAICRSDVQHQHG